MATERFDEPLSPSVAYWRDFACTYLTELCHTPESASQVLEPIAPPDTADLSARILNAPPMQGAEYLSEAALVGVWQDLDAWVRGEVSASGEGLSGFLQRRAPLWHQVGASVSTWPRTATTKTTRLLFWRPMHPASAAARASSISR